MPSEIIQGDLDYGSGLVSSKLPDHPKLAVELVGDKPPGDLQAHRTASRHCLGPTKCGVVSALDGRNRQHPTLAVDVDERDPDVGEEAQCVEADRARVADHDHSMQRPIGPGEPPGASGPADSVGDHEVLSSDTDPKSVPIDDADTARTIARGVNLTNLWVHSEGSFPGASPGGVDAPPGAFSSDRFSLLLDFTNGKPC